MEIKRKKIYRQNDVQGQDFTDAIFESCKFIGLSFKFVNFQGCTFKNCDFSESVLDSVGFFGCQFPGTKLNSLDFGSASIQNCNFAEAVAENCIFQKLKGGSKSERKNLDLRSCNFEGS